MKCILRPFQVKENRRGGNLKEDEAGVKGEKRLGSYCDLQSNV